MWREAGKKTAAEIWGDWYIIVIRSAGNSHVLQILFEGGEKHLQHLNIIMRRCAGVEIMDSI